MRGSGHTVTSRTVESLHWFELLKYVSRYCCGLELTWNPTEESLACPGWYLEVTSGYAHMWMIKPSGNWVEPVNWVIQQLINAQQKSSHCWCCDSVQNNITIEGFYCIIASSRSEWKAQSRAYRCRDVNTHTKGKQVKMKLRLSCVAYSCSS